MSKYLIWLIVFVLASVAGFFYFPAAVGGVGLALMLWLPIFGFTCALGALQWKAYSDLNHPGKTDALYARFLGMPIAEFNALSESSKASLMTEVQALKKKYGVILRE